MTRITLLHKSALNISLRRKFKWGTEKDGRSNLGRGRVLWIKIVTESGRKIHKKGCMSHWQLKALSNTKDPCVLRAARKKCYKCVHVL